MGTPDLSGPIYAAIIAAAVALLVMIVNTGVNIWLHFAKSTADLKLAERKLSADIELAERKLLLDRRLAEWKRKSELGEEVLADAYQARDTFKSARRPLALAGEGASRPVPADSGETIDEKQRRDAVYAPLERLNAKLAFFNEFSAKRWRFEAVFGDAREAFSVFVEAYSEIQWATYEMLNEMEHESIGDPMAPETRKRLRATLGWGIKANDEIGPKLDSAVTRIEEMVSPVLKVDPSQM